MITKCKTLLCGPDRLCLGKKQHESKDFQNVPEWQLVEREWWEQQTMWLICCISAENMVHHHTNFAHLWWRCNPPYAPKCTEFVWKLATMLTTFEDPMCKCSSWLRTFSAAAVMKQITKLTMCDWFCSSTDSRLKFKFCNSKTLPRLGWSAALCVHCKYSSCFMQLHFV